jgi:flavodoxin
MEHVMRTLVAFYSLTGHTRKVAEALAKELGADCAEIRCAKYRPGIWGAIKAGYDGWRGRLPAIDARPAAFKPYDLVVIGAPMWAFHAATPVRAYLKERRGQFRRVAFFLTLGGAPAERAFAEMAELAGASPAATLVVKTEDIDRGNYAAAIAAFAENFRLRAAA